MAYATVEDLRREMDTIDVDVDEVTLQEKLDEATDIIDRVTHRRFEASADETRTIDYSDMTVHGRTLHIPYDLCQITTITNGDADSTVITVDEYVTEPRLRTVSSGQSVMPDVPDAWPWYAITIKGSANKSWEYTDDPEEAISIVGRWAFSVTPPQVIRRACIRLAFWLHEQKNDLRDRTETAVSTDGVVLLMADLPEDIQRRLLPFVRL